MAYDQVKSRPGGHKEYLKLLRLAARENESAVDAALQVLFDEARLITACAVEAMIKQVPAKTREIVIDPVVLTAYDELLEVSC